MIFSHVASDEIDPEIHTKSVATAYGDQDVNIWSEPSTISTSSAMQQAHYLRGDGTAVRNLILEKASKIDSEDESGSATHIVKSATFNQLVLWLLSAESDSHFRNIFFVTLYSFASPQQFITKVEQRYTTPPGVPKLDQVELFGIANIMTYWVTTYGYEFSSHVYNLLNKFVENTFIRDGHVHIAESMQSAFARALHQRNLRRAPPSVRAQMAQADSSGNFAASSLIGPGSTSGGSSSHGPSPSTSSSLGSGLTGTALSVSPSNAPSALATTPSKPISGFPEPKLPKTIFELSMTLDDVDEEEIARQLTCLDAETFHMMKTRELIKNAWLKNRGKKAKRLVLLLNAANGLTKWVVDTLLVSTTQPGTFISGPTPNPNINPSAGSATSGSLNANSSLPNSSFNAPVPPGGSAGNGNSATSQPPLASFLRSKVSGSNLNANAVLTAPAIKRLTKLITRWIRVAEHLRNLNNFHSLLAIWTALRSRQGSAICDILKKELPKHVVDVR